MHRQKSNDCGTPHLKETLVDELDNSTLEHNYFNSDVIPKKLYDDFFDLTLDDTLKDSEEPLGSSTASNEAIQNNISSNNKPTKLLETNFDYVIDDKPKTELLKEDKAVKHSALNNIKSSGFEILTSDPRSPSIGIERTPIVVTKTEEVLNKNVEDLTDDALIKTLQNNNANLRYAFSKATDKNKDELLIYEDESNNPISLTPRKSVPESNSGVRTPLSCMKNKTEAHVRSKSANTYDPKNKMMPSSKHVSHIPRLKSLTKPQNIVSNSKSSLISISKTSAISGDCENTPPQSHRDMWDKDSSVVL